MKKKILLGSGIFLLIVIGVFGWVIYDEYSRWIKPWGTEADEFFIEIEKGMTARDVANILYEKNVIHSKTFFLALADLRGFSTKIRAGEYQIIGTQSPYDVIEMLAIGYAYRHALTIPEGYTQLQIAEKCEYLGICTKEAFLEECSIQNIFQGIIAQAPGGAHAACEGVLFPETYFFERNTPVVKVVARMISTFNHVWNEIREEATKDENVLWWWQEGDPNPKLEIYRVVVLASIIEREAKRDEDRAKIASVFINRTKKEMPLQADSTIHYAMNDWSRLLTLEDLEFDSPYNTYKNAGLPPAAICNPGRVSLQAAAMPENTTYLYFVTMPDGEAIFSATHDDHLVNKKQMKQERRNLAEQKKQQTESATVQSPDSPDEPPPEN
ncbi:MAG: endolytic transglycosylase MltG [Candidatus Omnitrophota bacterium]|jgi:UPF0755 protein|nr:MAG: endolytic transglycosylase MltG [Candidatus Omnitrophota bacterium]